MEEMISIPEVMFHPARMRKRLFLDELLSTLTTEPIQEVDTCMSEGVCELKFVIDEHYFNCVYYF